MFMTSVRNLISTSQDPIQVPDPVSQLSSKEIEDIWIFQCKIKFYFTEWTPNQYFHGSENTSFGVREWNKIQSYTKKNQIFCFFYAFIDNENWNKQCL